MSILAIAARGAPDQGFELTVVTTAGVMFRGPVAELVDDWVVFSKCTVSDIHNSDNWEKRNVVVSGDHVVAAYLAEPR